MTTLGSRIKAYREQLGISQYEVAERCTSIDNRDKNNKWGQSRIANYEETIVLPILMILKYSAKCLVFLQKHLLLIQTFSLPDRQNRTHIR